MCYNLWVSLDLDLNVDLIVSDIHFICLDGLNCGELHRVSRTHVKCGAMVNALQLGTLQLAVGKGKFLMGAPVLKSVDVTVDIGQHDSQLVQLDF